MFCWLTKTCSSWQKAFEAITTNHVAGQSTALLSFFRDEEIRRELARCLQKTPPPSSQSRSDFDSRTASINVAPAGNETYNISQLKDDALWLSKETKTDEILALRIALLEWQDRPRARLSQSLSEQESDGPSRVLNGSLTLRGSMRSSPAKISQSSSELQDVFQNSTIRRDRLLQMHVAEHRSLMGLNAVIAKRLSLKSTPSDSVAGLVDDSTEKDDMHDTQSPSDWIKAFKPTSDDVQPQPTSGRPSGSLQDKVKAAIDAIRDRIHQIERGSGWSMGGQEMPSMELDFQKNQLAELVHILQFIFVLINAKDERHAPRAVNTWFALMDEVGFFNQFELPEPSLQTLIEQIQILASIISLQMLRPAYTVETLKSGAGPSQGHNLDVFDLACQDQVNSAFATAAKNEAAVSGPAMFAWVSILQALTDTVISARARRMRLDRQYVMAWEQLESLPISGNQLEILADTSINSFNAYATISSLARAFPAAFGPLFDDDLNYHVRRSLLDIVRLGCAFTSYGDEILEAAVATLSPTDWTQSLRKDCGSSRELANFFASDTELLVPCLLHQALVRYPFEYQPLLQLCGALGSNSVLGSDDCTPMYSLLATNPRLTLLLPRGFNSYELAREDEAGTYIRLLDDLPLFENIRSNYSGAIQNPGGSSGQRSMALVRSEETSSCIPRGTMGLIVNDSKPLIVTWEFEYSVLSHLGASLSTALPGSSLVDFASQSTLESSLMAGTIRVFAAQLRRSTKTRRPELINFERDQSAPSVIQFASQWLSRDGDIIGVVCEIFEAVLANPDLTAVGNGSELLASCLEFISAVLPFYPARVWNALVSSDLLAIDGRVGRLEAIVSSLEMTTGTYTCLTACAALYEQLIEDIVNNAVSRSVRPVKKKTGSRYEAPEPPAESISSQTFAKVLRAFTRTFRDVFASLQEWKFVDLHQKLELYTTILKVFERILVLGHRSEYQDRGINFAASIAPSTQVLLDTFLAGEPNSTYLSPLLRLCSDGIDRDEFELLRLPKDVLSAQTKQTIQFVLALLDVRAHKRLLSHFLDFLLQHLSVLLHLYVTQESLKSTVIRVLTLLVEQSSQLSNTKASFFAHLSPETTHKVLVCFKSLAKPLNSPDLEESMWRLFSTAVQYQQTWFASYLLTGQSPRTRLREQTNDDSSSKAPRSMLNVALETVAYLENLTAPSSLAMLEFIRQAQNLSPWTTEIIRKTTKFLFKMIRQMGDPLEKYSRSSNDFHSDTMLANQTLGRSMLSDIFAMFLHNRRQVGDCTLVGNLVSDHLSNLFLWGLRSPQYKESLHTNLNTNFGEMSRGWSPENFKRLLSRPGFGTNYLYDMELAEQIMCTQSYWRAAKDKDKSFARNFERANVNLSLVEAQIIDLNRWKALAVELSNYITGKKIDGQKEHMLQEKLVMVIWLCFFENDGPNLPEHIAQQLKNMRWELALILIQKLVQARCEVKRMKTTMNKVWEAIMGEKVDFEVALFGPKASYHRTMLQTLLYSLQPRIYMEPGEEVVDDERHVSSEMGVMSWDKYWRMDQQPATQIDLTEITKRVISPAFRSISAMLHESPDTVLPSDLSLLISIFHSILQVPDDGTEFSHSQRTASYLSASNTHKYAVSLFSWSNRLIFSGPGVGPSKDPLYAELSLSFLLEFSHLSGLASHLATEGVLSQLSTASTMDVFRAEPPKPPRTNALSTITTSGSSKKSQHSLTSFGGVSPFDTPPRHFKLWASYILPLTLNIFLAAGPAFAIEAVTFLNIFSPQLRRAALSNLDFDVQSSQARANAARGKAPEARYAGCITFDVAVEVHTLALISLALSRARNDPIVATGGQEVPQLKHWDQEMAGIKEDLEGWCAVSLEALKGRVVPTCEKEGRMVERGRGELERKVLEELKGALAVLESG